MAAMPGPTDDDADLSLDTLAVHAGAEPDELTGAVAPPIYQTSTYVQDGVGKPRRGYEYARSQNPTRERLERAIATLEGGGHGFAFASGSAATAAIAELAAPGDEVVVGDDVYGGTYRYLEKVRKVAGVTASYVDLGAGPDVLWEALSERTRLVWFETPTNPLLKTVDIAAIAATVERRATEGGRRPLIVVDNTFASPVIQRPLTLGADIVFHSATKYLAGHSDRTASSCCAGSGRCTCGWSAINRTRRPWRRSCASEGTWRRRSIRGSAVWSRSCRPPARVGPRRNGRSPSPRGRACSPSPSRWAAWNP
jgi:cystathionine gamma-lyase